MPVNLSASGNLALGRIFDDDDDDDAPEDNVMVDGVENVVRRAKPISVGDLQDVANLFEIRKKKK